MFHDRLEDVEEPVDLGTPECRDRNRSDRPISRLDDVDPARLFCAITHDALVRDQDSQSHDGGAYDPAKIIVSIQSTIYLWKGCVNGLHKS